MTDASTRTLLLLDTGEPVQPARPPSWREVRRVTIASQKARCAVCGAEPKTKAGKPRLDVHVAASGIAVGLCRSHRLRHDAPTRIPRAVRTRAMNRGQPVIHIPRSSHDRTSDEERDPDRLLVIEALTLAHCDGAVTSPDCACRALLSVLRRRGMLPESSPVVASNAAPSASRKRHHGAALDAATMPLLDVGPPSP